MNDGSIICFLGHRHERADGAAGLYLVAAGRLLLVEQGRSASTDGRTWGLPGDTRAANENAQRAALRAAAHTVGLDQQRVLVFAEFVDNHGGWTHTTILARAAEVIEVSTGESGPAEWVPLDEVGSRRLDPSLAANVHLLRKLLDESAPNQPTSLASAPIFRATAHFGR